jgi:prepilin-type N-terminal cleavage/methylation domain-containing protein/prepilin-type processing-associated H-X9-DG protein
MGVRGADRGGRGAFTLIELAIVTVVIAVLVALILPAVMRPRMRTKRTGCVNNLKQVGLAFRIFANDNGERLPWEVATNQGGSREFVDVPFSAFHHFLVMSNELSTPRVLVCPQEQQRTSATNFSTFQGNQALSYFAGFDASDVNPVSILSGDRFLESTRAPTNGLLTLSPLSQLWWRKSPHGNVGNVVMGDGSVQQYRSSDLLRAVRNSGLATNRLALPLIGP